MLFTALNIGHAQCVCVCIKCHKYVESVHVCIKNGMLVIFHIPREEEGVLNSVIKKE